MNYTDIHNKCPKGNGICNPNPDKQGVAKQDNNGLATGIPSGKAHKEVLVSFNPSAEALGYEYL